MKIPWTKKSIPRISAAIRKGQMVVLPTDTLYGLIGSASNKKAVRRMYVLRKRDLDKPFIILAASQKDLTIFGIELTDAQKKILKKLWPGPVSVIVPLIPKKFTYLHRGTKSIAIRVPKKGLLSELLKQTGPLVAPSANTQGNEPATTITEAQAYFGSHVPLYADGGKKQGKASTLVRLEATGVTVLRQGSKKVPSFHFKHD